MTVAGSVRYITASAMPLTVEGQPVGERLFITSSGFCRCIAVLDWSQWAAERSMGPALRQCLVCSAMPLTKDRQA